LDSADLALLNDLLDGRLPPDEEERVRERLAREPALAAEHAALRRLREGIASLPGPTVPAGFSAGVRRRLASSGPAARTRWAAYAAAAVLGLGLGYASWRFGRGDADVPPPATVAERDARDPLAGEPRRDLEGAHAPDERAPALEDAFRRARARGGAGGAADALEARGASASSGRARNETKDGAGPVPPPRPEAAPSSPPVAFGGRPPPATRSAPAGARAPAPPSEPPAPPPPGTVSPPPGAISGYLHGMDEVLVLAAPDLPSAQATLAVLLSEVRAEALGELAEAEDEAVPPQAPPTTPPPREAQPDGPGAPAEGAEPAPAEAPPGDSPATPPAASGDRRAPGGAEGSPPPTGATPAGDARLAKEEDDEEEGAAKAGERTRGVAASAAVLGSTRVTLTPPQLRLLRARLAPAPPSGPAPALADAGRATREDDGGETPLLDVRVVFVAPAEGPAPSGAPAPPAAAPVEEPAPPAAEAEATGER
jgi:hypothetical protein